MLAQWCLDYHIWINVNKFHDGKTPGELSHPEFWILLKLSYQSARPNRLLEAMCATNFIIGAHHTMINEFGNKRMLPINRFLKDQRERNPQVVANDSELRLAVEKLDQKSRVADERHRLPSSSS